MRVFQRMMTTCVMAMGFGAGAAYAEDGAKVLSVELNTIAPAEQACTLTFVIQNGFEADIDKLVFETVLFTADGQVDRLTLFDFGSLPAQRPRVRQFAVSGLGCGELGQVLFNAVNVCDGAGMTPGTCSGALRTSSRVDIEVTG